MPAGVVAYLRQGRRPGSGDTSHCVDGVQSACTGLVATIALACALGLAVPGLGGRVVARMAEKIDRLPGLEGLRLIRRAAFRWAHPVLPPGGVAELGIRL